MNLNRCFDPDPIIDVVQQVLWRRCRGLDNNPLVIVL